MNINDVLQQGNLPMKTFSLDMIPSGSTILIVAKRNSGKSVLARAIMDHFKKIPIHIVISPTDELNHEYSSFVPESFVYSKYNPKILQKIFFRQKKIMQKAEVDSHVDPRLLLIMDDCASDKNLWKKDQLLSRVLLAGRHSKITYITLLQDSMVANIEMRANFDFIFLLANDSYNEIKRLYYAFAGMFKTFELFKDVFTTLTKSYGCMVIIKTQHANKELYDKVMYYKAPLLKSSDIRVGCKQMHEYDKNNKDKNWKDKKDNININELMNNYKKQKVGIERV